MVTFLYIYLSKEVKEVERHFTEGIDLLIQLGLVFLLQVALG